MHRGNTEILIGRHDAMAGTPEEHIEEEITKLSDQVCHLHLRTVQRVSTFLCAPSNLTTTPSHLIVTHVRLFKPHPITPHALRTFDWWLLSPAFAQLHNLSSKLHHLQKDQESTVDIKSKLRRDNNELRHRYVLLFKCHLGCSGTQSALYMFSTGALCVLTVSNMEL